jgi:hypothetical protein
LQENSIAKVKLPGKATLKESGAFSKAPDSLFIIVRPFSFAWISSAKYIDGEGVVELRFDP